MLAKSSGSHAHNPEKLQIVAFGRTRGAVGLARLRIGRAANLDGLGPINYME
jgi:hypothetical protein